jgi:hypothetical protein
MEASTRARDRKLIPQICFETRTQGDRMGRHIGLVVCMTVVALGPSTAVRAAESRAPECRATFAEFLARFESDMAFQLEHVQFPLQMGYVDASASPEPANREKLVTREEYAAKGWFYPSLEVQAQRRLEKKIVRPPTSNMVIEFDQPDSDAYSVNFSFTRTNGCWYLTRIDDQSL